MRRFIILMLAGMLILVCAFARTGEAGDLSVKDILEHADRSRGEIDLGNAGRP